MTDAEISMQCARAMGWETSEWSQYLRPSSPGAVAVRKEPGLGFQNFDPLVDDGQAMRLAKHFGLTMQLKSDGKWGAWRPHEAPEAHSVSLNRAICECVANMNAPTRTATGK